MNAVHAYLDLITSQHRQKPDYVKTVQALVEPVVELQRLLETMRAAFDLDSAVGVQLDATGERVGRTRLLFVPLEGVYFAWETSGVGWEEGYWQGIYDPESGLVSLPDDVYRILLRAKVAANSWDGTIPGAYEAWEVAFDGTGSCIFIDDYQDMSMVVGVAGMPPDTVMEQLLVQGYIPLKPAGVRIAWYAVTPDGGPLFAWDCDSPALAGWGEGRWPRVLTPTTQGGTNAA